MFWWRPQRGNSTRGKAELRHVQPSTKRHWRETVLDRPSRTGARGVGVGTDGVEQAGDVPSPYYRDEQGNIRFLM